MEAERSAIRRPEIKESLQPVKGNSVKYSQAAATRNYGISVFPSNLTEANTDWSELNFTANITSRELN